MRPILEFEISDHPEHRTIAIVPDGREYHILLNGKVHYGGTKFSLNDAKDKIDFLKKYLNIKEPVARTQDGQVLKPKRKRRTKAEMQEARREMEHAKRKRVRVNRAVTKKPRGRPPAPKRNR